MEEIGETIMKKYDNPEALVRAHHPRQKLTIRDFARDRQLDLLARRVEKLERQVSDLA